MSLGLFAPQPSRFGRTTEFTEFGLLHLAADEQERALDDVERQLRGFLGENLLRVWEEIESKAVKKQT